LRYRYVNLIIGDSNRQATQLNIFLRISIRL
jgi:hypothetical protein